MGGFFPHTGIVNPGYAVFPMSSFQTLLSDIVADVQTGGAGGVNGWTLHDDQRLGGGEIVRTPIGGSYRGSYAAAPYWYANSTRLSWLHNTDYGTYGLWAQPGLTPVSRDKTDWYTIVDVTNRGEAVLDRNYTGATGSGAAYTKLGGYIVLKCTSSQKNFYVKMSRTMDYLCPLRFQVFETWNATTHVGTGGGPEETVRAYHSNWSQRTAATKLQYILWLLPDVFALWIGGDRNEVAYPYVFSDFFYAGNLKTDQLNDTNALIQACTFTFLSGTYVVSNASDGTPLTSCGGAYCFKNLSGVRWWGQEGGQGIPYHCQYAIFPRGMSYIWAPSRMNLDDRGKMQCCEFDAWHVGSFASVNAPNYDGKYGAPRVRSSEPRRGVLRYVKCPVTSPVGMDLAAFGSSDDGNTYICVKASTTISGDYTTPLDYDSGYIGQWSGFAAGMRNTSFGGIVFASYTPLFNIRYFFMPTNL